MKLDEHAAGSAAIGRRAFLARGLLAGAGATLALPAGEALPASRPPTWKGNSRYPERAAGHRFTLSLAGYSFRSLLPGRSKNPTMSLEDFIDYCAAQDLEGTELTSYFFPRTDPEYLCSLKRRAFLNGLTITGTPVGNDFCVPPGPEREKQLAHVRDWIDRAALLGAPCIRVFAGRTPRGEKEADARRRCVAGLKEACSHAARRGVVLALENHGGITATAAGLLELIEAVDSPWLGVNLDTGNFRDRPPYEEMERAAPFAVVVQLKVEVAGKKGKKEPTDIPRVLDILRRARFRGVIALEYEAREDPLKAVPRYLERLKSLVRGA